MDFYNFPSAFHFCESEEVPSAIKSIYTRDGHSSPLEFLPAGQLSPSSFFFKAYDVNFPGWKCMFANLIPDWAGECANYDTARTHYRFCGQSADNEVIWPAYDKFPSGTQVAYTHGYRTKVVTEENICPSTTGALGAAIGYMGFIEMFATLLVVSFLVGVGIAKPRREGASVFNMLKGAGMAEFEEQMEKYKLKQESQ